MNLHKRSLLVEEKLQTQRIDDKLSMKPLWASNRLVLLGATAIAILIYVSFIAAQLAVTDNDLYGLYGFSQKPALAERGDMPWMKFAHPEPGYDGQYYFMLTLDPFTNRREAFGVTLDSPLLRHQRILLPFFAWLIARGDPALTPPVMMAINLAAIVGCAWVSGLLLSSIGISAWYGLLFALYPGFAISAGRFLMEPLAFFMILLSLLMLVRRKNHLAAIFLCLAVLSRETATLVVAAGFLTWLIRKISKDVNRDGFSPRVSFWFYPTVIFFLWQVWLVYNWSSLLFENATSANLGPPFVGFFRAAVENITHLNPETGLYLMMASAILAYHILISRPVLRAPLLLLISWICYLFLISCMGIAQWCGSPGFLRISTELNLLGLLAYITVKKRLGRLFVTLWLLTWVVTAGAEWYHLYLIFKGPLWGQ